MPEAKDTFASDIMCVLLDIPDLWEDEKYDVTNFTDQSEARLRDANLMAQGIAWGLRELGYGTRSGADEGNTPPSDWEAHRP